MNIFSKVTFETLKKNRTRTIVTIIGIILSAAMFTAVTTSITSLQSYMKKCTIYENGDWHGRRLDLPTDELKDFTGNHEIESIALAQNIGYADVGSKNDYKPYLFVMGADRMFLDKMPVHLTEGRLPDNSSEIILPTHLFSNGGVKYHIGDELVLELSDRYWETERLTQGTGFYPEEEGSPGETLRFREERTYTVTGFYERPNFEDYEAPGYTAVTLWDDSRPTETVAAYFRMTDPKETFSFANSLEGTTSWNSSLLRYEGASSFGTYYSVLYSFGAILIGLIMFGSVSLIYNAFSISVSERTKQFGLLSSIGATRKQIRKMVFTEATFVSLIGIPLGILSGVLGIGITFHFVGDKFYAFYGIKEVALRLNISPAAILFAAAIAYFTVLVSAWIPSRRATRVTAIEAIRQVDDINIKAKQVKTSKITMKLFGLEGVLAKKHYKRNRRRYRATVLSLFASVVLFISTSSYCMYLNEMAGGVFETCDYDIRCDWTNIDNEKGTLTQNEAAGLLGETEGVIRYSFTKEYCTENKLPFDLMPEDTAAKLKQMNYDPEQPYFVLLDIIGVDSGTFDDYVKDLGLKRDVFYDTENPRGIAMAQTKSFSTDSQRYEKMTLLRPDVMRLSASFLDYDRWNSWMDSSASDSATEEEYHEKRSEFSTVVNLEIGAFAETLPFGLNRSSSGMIYMVYPMEVFDAVFSDKTDSVASDMIYFKTTDHKAAMEKLTETAEAYEIPSSWLYDVYGGDEETRNMVTIINVFSYGFIILISLISLANVFNTVSTGILLRRREFAMLKSVGMTEGGFNRMLSYECILYGVKSLMYGIPVSFAVTWLIYKSVMGGYDTTFHLPWTAVFIAVCSVFLVVFSTMLYALSKVKKDNLIDALKNENY